MDQIADKAAKLRFMSGGIIKIPAHFRGPVGATGRGSQHAQNMERFFTGIPGLKVVAPMIPPRVERLRPSAAGPIECIETIRCWQIP